MPLTPRIADVKLTKIHFQPGDRIIVNVRQPIGASELAKLRRTVERWAGDHVEVLMVQAYLFDIEVQRQNKPIIFTGENSK